mgnify:FL=1
MAKNPIDYPWSSYDIYMGQRESEIVNEDKILSYFKDNSRELYKNYVESKLINQKTGEESEVI